MFSKRCFSDWCVQRVVRIRNGRRHQTAWKQWYIQRIFVPLKGFPLLQAEVRNLKNTVWKTPFRTFWFMQENFGLMFRSLIWGEEFFVIISVQILIFFSFWKTARKTTKKARILYSSRTLNSSGKKGKRLKSQEFLEKEKSASKGLPLPLGRGVCETKSKNGRSRPRKPFVSRVFCAQRGILTPWSQTMVSEGARPWGRGRSGDCEKKSKPWPSNPCFVRFHCFFSFSDLLFVGFSSLFQGF